MPKVVEVPGVGNVEFPDSMSDDQVSSAIKAQISGGAESSQKPGMLSDIGDTLKQYWQKINPVTQAESVAQVAAHPVDTVKSYGDTTGKLYESAKESFKKGNYSEGIRHTLSYFLNGIPGVGSALDEAGNKAGSGDYKGAIADTAALATGIAQAKLGPAAVDAVASKATGVTSQAGKALAEHTMQSALKPGVADASTMADVRSQVRTALDNEIPATEAGSAKLQTLIDDYGKRTQAVIDAKTKAGATVDPNAVARRLNDVNTVSALPEKAVSAVNKAREAFLARKGVTAAQPPTPTGVLGPNGQPIMRPGAPANPGNPIPLDVAQAEKQGSYQNAKNAYGDLSEAQVESEKALARGYKEELELQAPELKLLNSKESEFLGLQPTLERAIRREGNRDIVSMGDAAKVGVGGLAGGPVGAAAGLTARVIELPGLKSRLAIAINKASQRTGSPLSMAQSTAKAAAILGGLATATNTEGEPQQ